MIRNLYYLTLANNGSVLTRLIDSAEEEEYKETMLAYFFLWRTIGTAEGWTMDELDRKIEGFLKEVTGLRDQLRDRRRPRQALPPRPGPPRREGGSTPSRSTRPSSSSTGSGTTRSGTPDPGKFRDSTLDARRIFNNNQKQVGEVRPPESVANRQPVERIGSRDAGSTGPPRPIDYNDAIGA